jgi:transcriptional regulator with XRE-family HTH domain
MKLEDWMRQKNLTDQAMSKLIDTSRTAVTMYRNGQRIPKPDIARRIFEVTNKKVTPSDFIL